uniref:Uncharacterized protein n=1 Tax=Amphilophus citrinellus TaxID=61819 RepID=A0A3Q0RU97_AMPCI
MSGSMSSRAALFRSPTCSSNSEANTEDEGGRQLTGMSLCTSFASSFFSSSSWNATSSDVPDASLRCCR